MSLGAFRLNGLTAQPTTPAFTLAYFNSTTASNTALSAGSTYYITAPASINAGDLIVINDYYNSGGTAPGTSTTYPTGFTAIGYNGPNQSNGYQITRSSYKIATGSEGGTNIFVMPSSNTTTSTRSVQCIVYRASRAIVSVNSTSGGGYQGYYSTRAGQNPITITMSTITGPYIAFGSFDQGSSGATNTVTPSRTNLVAYTTFLQWESTSNGVTFANTTLSTTGSGNLFGYVLIPS
jgi:hypothetical protein